MNETDRGIGDESVSDHELRRYGQQLQNLLDQTEQRLRDSEGETMPSDDTRPSSDMAGREETKVAETDPENGTLRDMPGHVSEKSLENGTLRDNPGRAAVDVAGRNSKNETLRDMPGHVPEKSLENGTLRDIVSQDSSAEEIEGFAQETLSEPADATDPTTQVHRRQLLAISGLLCGSTISDTAMQIGVNRRTVHRWMQEPKFQAAYRHCEDELRMVAQAQVVGLAEKAVRCVSESLDRGNARVGMELLKQLRVFSTPDRLGTTLLEEEEES